MTHLLAGEAHEGSGQEAIVILRVNESDMCNVDDTQFDSGDYETVRLASCIMRTLDSRRATPVTM